MIREGGGRNRPGRTPPSSLRQALMRATGLEWVMTQRGGHRLLGGGGSQTPISITRCAGHPPSPSASPLGEPDSPPPARRAARTPTSITVGGWTAPRHCHLPERHPSASPTGEPPPHQQQQRWEAGQTPISIARELHTHLPPTPQHDRLGRYPPSTSLWGMEGRPPPQYHYRGGQ